MTRIPIILTDNRMRSYAGTIDAHVHLKTASYFGGTRKRSKGGFVPTTCRQCGSPVSYETISKDRLRAAGPRWIDTCDECAVTGATKS